MESTTTNYFSKFNAINVSDHIEKKGGFAYLSWPFAVAQLRAVDPTATWEVCRFDGLPYLLTDTGVFVEVAVTVQGIKLSQIHPVLDGRNRPILGPNAFDINSSIQRCLVKAIALHGLGLYIYAGEDLPAPAADKPAAANDAEIKNILHTASTDKTDKTPQRAPLKVNTTQLAQIKRLMAEAGADESKVLAYFGVDQLSHIPAADYPRVVRSLEKRRAA